MKYEKDMYSEGVSICCLLVAGAFIWGAFTLFFQPEWWFGFIPLVIGIAILIGQVRRVTSREKLRNVVKFEFQQNPNATVQEIANKTQISRKDVQAIILDLKARGQFLGKFSSKTGQFKTETSQELLDKQEVKKRIYCPNCGTQLKEGAVYCAYCGTKMN